MKLLEQFIFLLAVAVCSSNNSSQGINKSGSVSDSAIVSIPTISPQFPPLCGKNNLVCLPRDLLIEILKATEKKALYTFQCLSKYFLKEFAMPEFSSVYGELGFKFSGAYSKVLVCPGNFDLSEDALKIINHDWVNEITFTSIRTLMQSLDKIQPRHRLIVHSADYFGKLENEFGSISKESIFEELDASLSHLDDPQENIDNISKELIFEELDASLSHSDNPQENIDNISKELVFEKLHINLSHSADLELLCNLDSVQVNSLEILLYDDLRSEPAKKILSHLAKFKFESLSITIDFDFLGWHSSEELLELIACNNSVLKVLELKGRRDVNYKNTSVFSLLNGFVENIAPVIVTLSRLEYFTVRNITLPHANRSSLAYLKPLFDEYLSNNPFLRTFPFTSLEEIEQSHDVPLNYYIENYYQYSQYSKIVLVVERGFKLSEEAQEFFQTAEKDVYHVAALNCNDPEFDFSNIPISCEYLNFSGDSSSVRNLFQALEKNPILAHSIRRMHLISIPDDLDFSIVPNLENLLVLSLDGSSFPAISNLLTKSYSLTELRLSLRNVEKVEIFNQFRECLRNSPRVLRYLSLYPDDDMTFEDVYWNSIYRQ